MTVESLQGILHIAVALGMGAMTAILFLLHKRISVLEEHFCGNLLRLQEAIYHHCKAVDENLSQQEHSA